MAGGADFQAILREIARLQQSGFKLPPGISWTEQAAKNLAGGNVLSRLGQLASGAQNASADIIRDIKMVAILTALGVEGENLIQRIITERRIDLNPIPPWAEGAFRAAIQAGGEAIGAPLFDMFIRTPLGLPLSNVPGAPGSEAVRILERLFGVGVALDFGAGEVEDVLKIAMGANAPKGLTEALKHLPMNVGLNWATGFIVSQFVWQSYMPPLMEQANSQVRPTRLDLNQLAALLKRDLIDRESFDQAMAGLGWRDVDIERLLRLDEATLTLGDMQNAFLQGLMTEEEVRQNLHVQGYAPSSIDRLVEIYLRRAETAGGDQLRAVAQRGFIDGHLTDDQYRSFLLRAGVPLRSIDLEIEAATLVKGWQHRQLTVADIKRQRLDGVIDDAQAIKRLIDHQYDPEDARALLDEWLAQAAKTKSGLTEAQILAYLRAGVLTQPEAYDRLITLGIRAADASFLVRNPSAITKGKAHTMSEATIVAAYKDGILTLDDAQDQLVGKAGLTADAAKLRLQVANVEVNRTARVKQPHKHLTEAQVLEAFKLGLASDTWAVRELGVLGYSDVDAHLLVTIEETKQAGSPPPEWSVLS